MGEELTGDRWLLDHEGRHHVVTVDSAVTRRVTWSVDGDEVATKRTTDDDITLRARGDVSGSVSVKMPKLPGSPARRVRLHAGTGEATLGVGGVDFAPEPGSRAAARQDWIAEHPRLHVLRSTATAVAGVGLPLLGIWLLTLIPWPAVDLPSLPLPDIDLPSIPWPDISIPRPDLPDLPGWVDPILKFGVPILIAIFLATGESRRQRRRTTAAASAADRPAAGRPDETSDEPGRADQPSDQRGSRDS